jgi:hypothetical protein
METNEAYGGWIDLPPTDPRIVLELMEEFEVPG